MSHRWSQDWPEQLRKIDVLCGSSGLEQTEWEWEMMKGDKMTLRSDIKREKSSASECEGITLPEALLLQNFDTSMPGRKAKARLLSSFATSRFGRVINGLKSVVLKHMYIQINEPHFDVSTIYKLATYTFTISTCPIAQSFMSRRKIYVLLLINWRT